VWITSSLDTIKTPTTVALGNFDGIHRGHRQVILPILAKSASQPESLTPLKSAQQLPVAGSENGITSGMAVRTLPYPTVVTFHPHPREFFTGERRSLLTPLDEKVRYLRAMGVEQLVLLPFNRTLADMLPEQFVEQILVKQLQAQHISIGQDFCFGRNRTGTTTELKAIAALYGISVQIAPLHMESGERISSSAIRQALQAGELARANQLLGRPYTLIGEVVQGQQLGRTLGFPTANLKLPTEKFLPRQGVYAVRVSSPDLTASASLIGVMNLGNRPTVDGMTQTVEVHLLDWSGNLYGKELTVSLEHFLRPEQKFASLDALKSQIWADCATARSLFKHQLAEASPGEPSQS
jgi:riboflavin kinase / FMN adenylyltransferase